MARLIVGTEGYLLPTDTDIDQLADRIATAMTGRQGIAIAVVGDEDQELRLIVNCGLVEQIVIDSAADDDGITTKGGRISGKYGS